MTEHNKERALYMEACENFLAWLDLTADVGEQVAAAVEVYGDPLRLMEAIQAVRLPDWTTDTNRAPEGPQMASGGVRRHKAEHSRHNTRTAHAPDDLDRIVLGLVVSNPGRTVRQLCAAMEAGPEEQRFHPPTMSSVVTRLVRGGKVFRVVCDTDRGTKLYALGAVPPDARVIPGWVDTSRIGRDKMVEHSRPPTARETGGASVTRIPRDVGAGAVAYEEANK